MTHPGIRDLIDEIAPPWLQVGPVQPDPAEAGVGGRLLYTLCGLSADLLVDKVDEAMLARMPTRGDGTALPYIGNDRQIIRGLADTDQTYAGRLQQAFDAWQRAGSDRGVMSQVLAYLPLGPLARAVSTDSPGNTLSTWRTYVPGADVTREPSTLTLTANWDWDSLTPWPSYTRGWWRWWLVIFSLSPYAWTGTEGNWGDAGNWGDTTASWGLSVPATEIQVLQALGRQWKRAGSTLEWIIVSFSASLFDPAQAADGTHNPDGTWGHWSKIVNGAYVPSRLGTARYCDGAI